jgi:hypothetical protein
MTLAKFLLTEEEGKKVEMTADDKDEMLQRHHHKIEWSDGKLMRSSVASN